MYNIIQLNDMEVSELQSIAKELGIKNAESMKKDQLVYGILDEQAIVNASKKTVNKEKDGQQRKRSRINVKKEGDKVYTATQDKAQKLEANTPEIPAKDSPFNTEIKEKKEEAVEIEQAPQPAETAKAEKAAPKKRGRKPKAEKAEEKKTSAQLENTEKEETVAEEKQSDASVIMAVNDFIPIEDLPSEKIELPSELIGKFEATKGEATSQQPEKQLSEQEEQQHQQYQ